MFKPGADETRSPRDRAPDTLAIVDCTVVDVVEGRHQQDMTVIVWGERIAGVSPAASIELPPETHIVQGAGTWVMPGLVDMHVHVAAFGFPADVLPLYLACGVTTIRDCGGNLTRLLLLRDSLKRGETIGPRLFLAGPFLDGMPPVWPDSALLVDTPERAAGAVPFLHSQGVDFIKIYNHVPETSLRTIVAAAHERGLPVAGHVPRSITTSRAVQAGMDCLEHIRITGRELLEPEEANRIDFLPIMERELLLWERFDLDSPGMHRLIDYLAESRVFLDPTLVVDAALFARLYEGVTLPLDDHFSPSMRAALDAIDMRNVPKYQVSPEAIPSGREGFRKRLDFIRRCNEAGVRLLAGTDALGLGPMLPGISLHEELAYLTQAGLTPAEALRAATATAADALGKKDETGTIEAGKLADLVILEADPLADIANARRVQAVVHRGRLESPGNLLHLVAPGASGASALRVPRTPDYWKTESGQDPRSSLG